MTKVAKQLQAKNAGKIEFLDQPSYSPEPNLDELFSGDHRL
jgi:hypothetical protein